MTTIRWTEQAADDLSSIREFVGRSSTAYAQLAVARLYAAVSQLREFPESGRVVPERGQIWLRELVRPPYRIVYRHANDLVEILTVFHSARMFPESLP